MNENQNQTGEKKNIHKKGKNNPTLGKILQEKGHTN